MAKFKTPGVYIKEISTLPASVAAVATAIPGFVGYTQQQAALDGETLDHNTPVRIESLLEFEQIFGGSFSELFDISIANPAAGETNPQITATANAPGLSPYLLYYQLTMFFENGGGPCWVTSVGVYSSPDPTAANISESELSDGLDACAQIDEITLLLVPEAILLDANGRQNINDAMLSQCNKLQDRFAIIDALTNPANTVFDDGNNFRADVGSDNLKYGAAYYPSLKTTIKYDYTDANVAITDTRTGVFFNGQNLGTLIDNSMTATVATAIITVEDNTTAGGDIIVLDGVSFTISSAGNRGSKASNLQSQINDAIIAGTLGDIVTVSRTSRVLTLTAKTIGVFGNSISLIYNATGTAGLIVAGFSGGNDNTDRLLYTLIKKKLEEFKLTLYPSGAMAGAYARVDRDRGVWKAPANISLRLVDEPLKLVTDAQQESLNVDADSGKSINVVRKFAKRGILVWGARTLAGNDNEWRYVPVRRLFIFIEESIEKATEPSVFEPNDAQTWTKLKAMIENFLTKLWREGALAGAKPEDAFFVNVGLGKTMTAVDILEGKLIIEVGIAAVRPAEFIILKFMHKMQES